MKFKELFTSADGIFTVFEQSFPDEFEKLFGKLTPESLNILALGMYGNKTIADYILTDEWKSFVETVINMKLFNWLRLNEAITAEYAVTQDYKIINVKTGTEQVTVADNSENLTANKPFNSNDFDNGERQQRTGQKDETRDYNLTTEKIRSNSGGDTIKTIVKEIALRKKNLQKEIISEIVGELTLSVYV